MLNDVSLSDRYDLEKSRVLLNGSQALVRLMLMQSAIDRANGLNTAGYVTGYRGSPLGAVDQQMTRASEALAAHDVVFQAGINEDLAATALWGTQQAGLRGDGTHDGVFGLWYGKGPGVDRSGDAFRHANMAGTARSGGVLMALGDDHTGESSTTCHQSDLAVMDAYVPLLSPAGVQEILDFGLYGYALSRFSGLWAGLKLMKDTVEVTSVVDAPVARDAFILPDIQLPDDGLNIRLGDHWVAQEARLVNHKRAAAEAFARANRIDRCVYTSAAPRIGFVGAGKNWLDLVHAMDLLGIDQTEADHLGITTYKIGQVFPLDRVSLREWADELDLIVVVEEKRKLIEAQVKEALFDQARRPRVYGYQNSKTGRVLFPLDYTLDPVQVAVEIGSILVEEGVATDRLKAAIGKVSEITKQIPSNELASRLPYFCSGCPHNTSTVVPEGSRAYAGIGCHTMALWMDRETSSYTHMGAEGAQWIGESQFSKTGHVFQNMGDGTYNHSGLMAIRAAVAADTNITFKLLYNDAVALTGGQTIDGDPGPDRIAHELVAAGVGHVAVVFDEKEEPKRADFPASVSWQPRSDLNAVQERLRETPGVTAILYVQTCAAEKRRRRRRGTLEDPDTRVFINADVCEGCGDCGVQSNCVSIVPLETEFGRKRAIDQSSCNKDYSCLKGFCPSFVTVKGGTLKKPPVAEIDYDGLPEPTLPEIAGTHNVVITGIGGTGVVTIGAVLAMAAHVDGKGASMMEMAGLAQKGGAVHIHCRIANEPGDIRAVRVAPGEADTVIGGDIVVTSGTKTVALMHMGRTGVVLNSHKVMTGAFTRDVNFALPTREMEHIVEDRVGNALMILDTSELARRTIGDTLYSNMILLGIAWQRSEVPLTRGAIMRAIELNGVAVDKNLRAFEVGRWAAENQSAAENMTNDAVTERPQTTEDIVRLREEHLEAYQGKRLAWRYRSLVDRFESGAMREAVAKGYHKVLAYKDEYEVARLLTETRAKADDLVEGDFELNYHLAPPFMSGQGPDGRLRKRVFSSWIERVFPVLARFRILRGTWLDPFGYTGERRLERRLIRDYESDMSRLLKLGSSDTEAALALALLPLEIRGFGPVKEKAAASAGQKRAVLLRRLEEPVVGRVA